MATQCKCREPRVFLTRAPRGYPGTRQTVHYIGQLIRQGAKDFRVRQTAIDVFFAYRVRPKDYLGEISALFDWVRGNIRYTRDIYRVELLHTARRMLELRAGDCDDHTILLGAMLKSTGHPVRLVLVGFDPRRPKLYTHIFLETRFKNAWIALDTTVDYPMGWSPRAVHRKTFRID